MIRIALLLPLLALAGCATADAGGGRRLAAGDSAALARGESVTLPDASTLTYVGVRSDSRCRPNVQCIQAGTAVVEFRHAARDFTLGTTQASTAELGAWRLTLVSLDFASPPNATVRVDAR